MSADRIYAWEANEVEPCDNGVLSRDDAMDLVNSAARTLGIPMPTVRIKKGSFAAPCKAVPAKWTIELSDWGRNKTTVLHEMAHLATVDAVLRGEDGHGPTFIGTAICLYAVYLKLDPARLITSAMGFGIEVGFPASLRRPRNFSDIEF